MYIPKREAMAHPLRCAMLRRVEAEPGIGLCDLADAFGVTPSTILWHGRKLAAADLLRMEREGRRRLFFATASGQAARVEARRRQALRDDKAVEALATICAGPGITLSMLAQRLGIGVQAARQLMTRLVRAGIVHTRRDRPLHYYADPSGPETLKPAREALRPAWEAHRPAPHVNRTGA